MVASTKEVVHDIPDIEGITNLLGVGRLDLVTLASGIARQRNISPTAALFLLQQGKVTLEEAKEILIQKFQTEFPHQEEDDEDDTSNESEQTVQ